MNLFDHADEQERAGQADGQGSAQAQPTNAAHTITAESILARGEARQLDEAEIAFLLPYMDRAAAIYYDTEARLLPDPVWDALDRLLKFNGIQRKVGAAPIAKGRLANIEHGYDELMGSLDNVYNVAEFMGWLRKTLPAGLSTVTVVTSLKGDGSSGLADIDDARGRVGLALTRGKGGQGRDITAVFGQFHTPPGLFGGQIGLKAEILTTYEGWQKACAIRGETLNNPRSAVSGILGRDDAERYIECLSFAPLALAYKDGRELPRERELELMAELAKHNSSVVPLGHQRFSGTLEEIEAHLEKLYAETNRQRFELAFAIDGIVVEILDQNLRNELGWTSGRPNYARALKLPAAEAGTTVRAVERDLGLSGRITPCVVVNPVQLNGNTYQRVSLANMRRFRKLRLGEGSQVLFQLRGDVIGYVDRISEPVSRDCPHCGTANEIDETLLWALDCDPERPQGKADASDERPKCTGCGETLPYRFADIEAELTPPLEMPQTCPGCGGPVRTNAKGTFLYCASDFCQERVVGRLVNWLSKLDIKGLKGGQLERLIEAGLLRDIRSLYHLDYDRLAALNGFGTTSALNIRKALEAKRELADWQVLGSIGIESIGRTVAKSVCAKLSLRELLTLAKSGGAMALLQALEQAEVWKKKNDLLADAAAIAAEEEVNNNAAKVAAGVLENLDLLTWAIDGGDLSVREHKAALPVGDGPVYTFVITGALRRWAKRDHLKDLLEGLGHKVTGKVTEKTDFLIQNELSGTDKEVTAKKLGKTIIDEDRLVAMLGLE